MIRGGYHIPLDNKFKKHHFQIFPIFIGNYQYYIKIGTPVQPLPVRIHSADQYEIITYRQRLVFGFYLGLIFFVILSNLFFYISLKNKLFLFYSGIVLVYLSYASMVMDGFIVYFIDNVDLQFWYKNIPTIGVPLQMMYALVFLEMSKYSPRLSKYTWWLIYYFIAYAVIKFFIPVTALLAMNTLHALISFFGMCYLGYKAGKKGNRLGKYFALAYLIYFILVLVEATYIQIGTPGYFMELSHVAWATLIEAFILSFLLSKRFEWEREETELEKTEAQKQLLEKTLENEKFVKEQNLMLEKRVNERTEALKNSLENLKQAQTQLIHSEKMASLGELTAGIAHEIQNPLNFVNNFSEVSSEMVEEIFEYIEKGDTEEIKAIAGDLKANLDKITHHGKRAGDIVKGMLQHSRNNQGVKEPTNINDLCNEYIKLAYHGFRAKDKSFNASLEIQTDPEIPVIELASQDVGRVILNIITNAFFAVNERSKSGENGYKPTVWLITKKSGDQAEIVIRDNGLGIPDNIREKIFQPFFTTKPTGQGTGLGLSLSYDIIKALGGSIKVESENGDGSVFTIFIPLQQTS
jgi:signal transduction histidine kinase